MVRRVRSDVASTPERGNRFQNPVDDTPSPCGLPKNLESGGGAYASAQAEVTSTGCGERWLGQISTHISGVSHFDGMCARPCRAWVLDRAEFSRLGFRPL